MKCIVLAAGYATRLYPLTKNFPKPLLDVGGRPILNWLLDDLEDTGLIDEYILVSNHRFVQHFSEWKASLKYADKVTVIDDGSTDNDNRLGAVRDIAFAIEQCNIDDDTMVIAGDNILDFSLNEFIKFFYSKQATCVMRYYESSVEKLRRTGVATVDDNERVISMIEKPQNPASHWAVPPFYIYSRSDLVKVMDGIKDPSCNVDAPGSFIAWLCGKCDVYSYIMPGKRHDIGNLESLEEARKFFAC